MNLKNKLKQLAQDVIIIEKYNKYYILDFDEEIQRLKSTIESIQKLSGNELKKELTFLCEDIGFYLKQIPNDFIKSYSIYKRDLEKEMFSEQSEL